jgi:superfamily II DNA/RNA helicase
LFFSATYPDRIRGFIKTLIPENSIKIELPKEKLTLTGIKQFFHVAKRTEGEKK